MSSTSVMRTLSRRLRISSRIVGCQPEAVQDVRRLDGRDGTAQGHEVQGGEFRRFLEIEEAVPVDDFAQGVEEFVLVGVQDEARMGCGQYAEFVEAAQAGFPVRPRGR